MKTAPYLLLLLACNLFAQFPAQAVVYASDTNSPLEGAYVTSKAATSVTNSKGEFTVALNRNELVRVSYMGYRDTLIREIKDTIFLRPSINPLKEVTINQTTTKQVPLRALVSLLYDFEINFGFGDRAAVYIPSGPDSKGRVIAALRYNVKDVYGVKNLKYLPFKAAAYSVDTLTMEPGRALFPAVQIRKSDNKKWVDVDIASYNIKMPEEGIFVVFELLGKEAYETEYIESEAGIINAVPSIGAEVFKQTSPNRSYLYHHCEDCEHTGKWEFIPCHFEMDVKFNRKHN